MELFAGFNAEELAMMQELLRLLVEDDEVVFQQPTPCTSSQQNSLVLFDGLTGASPKLASDRIRYGNYYSRGMGGGGPNGMAWNAPPVMIAPTPEFATKASRTRPRSNLASDEEPMFKRGRVDVTLTKKTPMNCFPVPEVSRAGYRYY